jgi:hypothetical protein
VAVSGWVGGSQTSSRPDEGRRLRSEPVELRRLLRRCCGRINSTRVCTSGAVSRSLQVRTV